MRGKTVLRALPLVAALVATAATAVFAQAAVPITPSNALFSTYCGTGGGVLDAVAKLTAPAGASARGAAVGVKEPALNDTLTEVPAARQGKGGRSFSATIGVYFHVITSNGVGNVSNESISQQMTVLNMGFGGFEGGFNTASSSSCSASTAPRTRRGSTRTQARPTSGR
jgi:hypothetical protein